MPNEDSTYEQQYEYSVNKQKYDKAQDNLKTLETYLNSYDQLAMINFVHKFLHEMLNKIDNVKTIEDVDKVLNENEEQIKKYFFDDK
ncbi:MAG: hypothetical protein J6W16_04030 [Methanobrevibacter sp.]|nr:hypothetical protein [Methanobrevibacter sp.]